MQFVSCMHPTKRNSRPNLCLCPFYTHCESDLYGCDRISFVGYGTVSLKTLWCPGAKVIMGTFIYNLGFYTLNFDMMDAASADD